MCGIAGMIYLKGFDNKYHSTYSPAENIFDKHVKAVFNMLKKCEKDHLGDNATGLFIGNRLENKENNPRVIIHKDCLPASKYFQNEKVKGMIKNNIDHLSTYTIDK